MSARQVAARHYRDRLRLIRAIVRLARQAWRQVDQTDIAGSWRAQIPQLLVALIGAQLAAAQTADEYLTTVLAEQGIDPEPEGVLIPSALAGIASDGRDLESLLYRPVVAAKVAIGGGASPGRALAVGQVTLDAIVQTQVADAGRVADQVALTARREATGYVRMVVGASCARCIILAGRWYRWSQGFQRHPRCDCVHIPSRESIAGDITTSPRAIFESMSPEEQDRVFGKDGARAIRDGADMARVVNARRGMYTAGGLRLTREATTRRGIGRPVRLMPEEIYRQANGNRDEALRLLRLHGYIR